jgi:hypothetical protein
VVVAWSILCNPFIGGDTRGRLSKVNEITWLTCNGVFLELPTFGMMGVEIVQCSN